MKLGVAGSAALWNSASKCMIITGAPRKAPCQFLQRHESWRGMMIPDDWGAIVFQSISLAVAAQVPDYGAGILALYIIATIVLGVPIIVIVSWTLRRGFQKGVSLWRTLAVGILAVAGTIGAMIGWWHFFAWIDDRFFYATWKQLMWLGFLVIPIMGIAVGVWAIKRPGRPRERQPG